MKTFLVFHCAVPTPNGSASLQLAFKVSAPEVDQCAAELARQGVDLLGNLLEVFAEI